jgi:hypothetical protein
MNRNAVRGRGVSSLVGLVLAAGTAWGQQTFSTYTGADFGAWSSPGNWDNLMVPTSAGDVAIVPGPRIVNLNLNVTLDKYGVGGVLRVLNGQQLGVQTQTDGLGVTGIFGGGTTALESVGTGTYLRLFGPPGSYAVHGNSGNPSFIQMSNTTANIIDGTSSGILLYNEGTIQGSGQVGVNVLNFNNTGSMIAQFPGGNLIIDPAAGGFTNAGLLQSQGGNLLLQNGVFTNTGAGSVNIAGGTGGFVTVTGSRIVGGTMSNLSNPDENFRFISSSTLQGVLLAGEGRVPNGHVLHVEDSLTLTGGVLYLDSVGTGTYLRMLNNVTLNGTNRVQMSNSGANIIDAQTTGLTLTNNLAGGIVGSGQLGTNTLNIVNNTDIYASGSAGLIIDPAGATPLENFGRLWALTGSSLTIQNGTLDNNGQWHVMVQPNAACVLVGVTVLGGNLNAAQPNGLFTLINSSVLDGVTLTPSTVSTTPNGHLNYWQGTINQQGLYQLSSAGTGTYIRILGNVVATGGGTIACSGSTANIIDAQSSGNVLTLQDQTIRGSLQLGTNSLAVVNNSLIEAQGSGGIIIDSPGTTPFDNNTVVRALSGSSLTVQNSVFDNSGGLMEIQAGAAGTFTGVTMRNGLYRSIGGSIISLINSNVLENVTIDAGTITNTPNGHLNYWQGSLVNNGEYRMSSVGTGTHVRILDSLTLSGSGLVAMSASAANVLDAQSSGLVLTLQGHTLRGSAQIGTNSLAVVNNGLIEAQGSGGIIIDSPGSTPFDNNTVLRALAGSSLTLQNSVIDGTGGLVELQAGAAGTITGCTLVGGTYRGLGGSGFSLINSNSVNGVTFDAGTASTTPNGHLNYLVGTLDNRGTFVMASAGSGTYFRVNAPAAVLTGGGTLTANSNANIIDAQTTGNVLTIQNQTVRGAPQIGTNNLAVVNRGAIIADQAQTLIIDPPSASGGFLNDVGGLLHAQGAGGIVIAPGPFTTAGTVIADAGTLINRTGDAWTQTGGLVIANGEIQVVSDLYQLQGGTLAGSGRVDSNVLHSGGAIAPGMSAGELIIEGTLSQGPGAALHVEVAGPGGPGVGFDRLIVTGAATLSGTISALATNGYTPVIGETFDVLVAGSRSGTFTAINSPEFSVSYTPTTVRLTYTGPRCDPDVNQDGNVDQDDVSYLINVIGGGDNPAGTDPDYNQDGNVDQDDVIALINTIAGGGCP